MNTHLNILLRKYLPSIAGMAGRYITPFDWKNEYEIWSDHFKKYTDSRKLDKLKEAFKQLLSQNDIKKMPTPGCVEGMIREENSPVLKPKTLKPPVNPGFQKVVRELVVVLGKKKSCSDVKEKEKLTVRYNEIVEKMKAMSRGK